MALLDDGEARRRIRAFAAARDWGRFHTPKNLSMALIGEAAELVELFQWLTPEQSAAIMADPDQAEAVRDELADVLYYTIRLADVLDVDLAHALEQKLAKGELRYPVEASRGSARKRPATGPVRPTTPPRAPRTPG